LTSFLFCSIVQLKVELMRRLVNSRIKSLKLAIAVILATFFVNRLALAEGYTVEFAVEVGDRQDGGSVKCQFDRFLKAPFGRWPLGPINLV
jgi:hypothetical protein